MNTAVAIKEPITNIETDKVGRPCKYLTHVEPYLDKVYEWLTKGYTDYSIAEQLGIHEATWHRYKQEYVDLTSLYTRARTQRNALVMNSMFSKATGVKEKVNKAKVLNDGKIIEYTEEQYIPPDVNAADLYLRNNSDEYKSAKADISGLTLIQNNYQLPEIQAQIKALEDELKKLDAIDTTYTEVE